MTTPLETFVLLGTVAGLLLVATGLGVVYGALLNFWRNLNE